MTAAPGAPGRTNEQPLVSVLLATRNGSRYLEESLATLAAQTYPEVEIIAVDDGSADRTPDILSAFASRHPRTRLHRADAVGLAGALAMAAAHARGVYLARQDDDDRSHPERIARQVAHLESHPAIDVLGTGATVIDERGNRIEAYPVPADPARMRRTLRRATPFVHGSVMMRRAAYDRAGGYRAGFRASQDLDLWLRLGADAVLANLPEALYEWRRHPGGVYSRARADQLFYSAVARAFADERRLEGCDSIALLDSCATPPPMLERYRHAGRLAFYLGEIHAREGHDREARRYLRRALSDSRSRTGALAWWLLSWGLPFTARGRRARAHPSGAVRAGTTSAADPAGEHRPA